MTDPWVCPNTPRCEHPGLIHDIWDYDDPRPMCCADGCDCGKPTSGLPPLAIGGPEVTTPEHEAAHADLAEHFEDAATWTEETP